jgi:hypothetical protein
MSESWLERRARLRREKKNADAIAKSKRDLQNIQKAQEIVRKKRAADQLAKQREKRAQRRRNQGK